MVVPLKLTQFYGHSVPRPRIYADVKFSDRRVDPPPSVNDALLSWASDAHWSMGGLSSKTSRSQGKVEGNVHKLRAFLEEEEAPDTSKKAKTPMREAASKSAENVATVKLAKVARGPIEKKRQRSDEESVEATPARKLTRREAASESTDEGSPAFVPATHEKVKEVAESVPSVRKKGLKLPAKAEAVEEDIPSSVAPTLERRREKLFSSSGKTPRGLKSPADNGNLFPESSPTSDGGWSTRSGIKKADASVQLSQSLKGKPRARKILTRGTLPSDESSCESDDGLEVFLKEKRCTPRRSSRLVKEQGKCIHASQSHSDSDSE